MSHAPVSFDPPEGLRSIYNDNAANSLLLRLPLWLRLRIYRHCIRGYWIEVQGDDSYTRFGPSLDSKPAIVYSDKNGRVPADKHPKLFALAQTCRQMLEEAWLLPYQLSVFTINKSKDFELFFDCIALMTDFPRAFETRRWMRMRAINALMIGTSLVQKWGASNALTIIAGLKVELPYLEKVYLKSWEHVNPRLQRLKEIVEIKLKIVVLKKGDKFDQEG